ncbi:unnamed protein product [Zymoseptoria tritici ST99CH_1A5]|uniref:Uncharacterized protein n=2 Tax=Zymoseptoria tritici TaxID=1047171 RepID=F9X6V1_ZYMTI|nr:uncharacterized protein MYCGRDRAFT_103676 [Zymoseptoria tritici IPO323]EGP88756.1 hypothetical protein MYCGRDRAFT_103676 [Zymoseptoria tritici IPO323]SMR49721.1 unnamed protein product [Zymoseptoria tritici ST99CH_3D1]SMY22419.1 unnamed protein product [Zymoseptoria tritici ST99CH_1A5]
MASQYQGPGATLWAHMPPPAECLAILVGCAEVVVFGLGGLANPSDFSNGYGLPIDAATEGVQATQSQKTQSALVKAIASRHVQNGALILTFGLYTRNRTALGFAVAYSAISALADTLLVKNNGVDSLAGGHVIAALNSLLVGGALLYWKRDDKIW